MEVKIGHFDGFVILAAHQSRVMNHNRDGDKCQQAGNPFA